MSDKRAETYLRRLAEAELRRAGGELRRIDAEAEADITAAGGRESFAAASRAQWKIVRTGRILVAAGALDQGVLERFAADFDVALYVRSRFLLNHDRRQGALSRSMAGPPRPAPPAPVAMMVTPIGRALTVTSGRVPSVLHFLSVVRTPDEALLTVVMRMHWPPDGSSADLEISGGGPHFLPYDQLTARDDRGSRYTIQFEGGPGGENAWRGIARLSPVPPPTARRLDLIGDGNCLIELPLIHGAEAVPAVAEPSAISPGERLLVLEAERILATREPRGPVHGPGPGEIITVLREAGAIAADSPLPDQLTALGQQLGADWPGSTVAAATDIPVPWASIVAGYDPSTPEGAPELFAPAAMVLPDVDGARIALAGLSLAASESYLHVISSGLPELTDRFALDWTPEFSWWLRDSAGNWHVAAPGEPWSFGDGMQAFRLRLTPPLVTPGPAEIMVTGPATQVRAAVLIGPAEGTAAPKESRSRSRAPPALHPLADEVPAGAGRPVGGPVAVVGVDVPVGAEPGGDRVRHRADQLGAGAHSRGQPAAHGVRTRPPLLAPGPRRGTVVSAG